MADSGCALCRAVCDATLSLGWTQSQVIKFGAPYTWRLAGARDLVELYVRQHNDEPFTVKESVTFQLDREQG